VVLPQSAEEPLHPWPDAITLEILVRLQAIALPDADGGFTVVIPALGCATEGDTIEEAQANAVKAAEGWLTSQRKRMKDEAMRATEG
jgi:predicted RNase H-like HicB family nuclease